MVKHFIKHIVTAIITYEARLVLKKYKPRIIAVTGTAGKTGTKDAIFEVLSTAHFVRKSEKSFNSSEWGVALTVLGRPTGWNNPLVWMRTIVEGILLIVLKNHYPKWLVLEIGTGMPGEIPSVMKWLRPDAVVVTRMASVPVHVEFFGTPEAVFEEKAALVRALGPDGLLVLNADDKKVMAFGHETDASVLTFGMGERASVIGMHDQILYEDGVPVGMTCKVQYEGNNIPLTLHGVIGKHYLYEALAALVVGVHFGCNLIKVSQALTDMKHPPGRSRIIPGLKHTTIIDDTYNSSPVASEAALEALAEVDMQGKGKRIAVLGDMLELGQYTMDEHKRIGRMAGEICNKLIAVGPRAAYFAEGALLGGMSEKNILQFGDAREAGKFLEGKIKSGDIILIKGSQSMRMERAVQEIMAHPEDRAKLLVRQEEAWERR